MEDRRLEELENKLNTVDEKVDDVGKNLEKVLTALTGSELSVGMGLVGEMSDVKKRLLRVENWQNRVIWMSVGAGVAGGFTITKLIEWIQEAAR